MTIDAILVGFNELVQWLIILSLCATSDTQWNRGKK